MHDARRRQSVFLEHIEEQLDRGDVEFGGHMSNTFAREPLDGGVITCSELLSVRRWPRGMARMTHLNDVPVCWDPMPTITSRHLDGISDLLPGRRVFQSFQGLFGTTGTRPRR